MAKLLFYKFGLEWDGRHFVEVIFIIIFFKIYTYTYCTLIQISEFIIQNGNIRIDYVNFTSRYDWKDVSI